MTTDQRLPRSTVSSRNPVPTHAQSDEDNDASELVYDEFCECILRITKELYEVAASPRSPHTPPRTPLTNRA